MTTDLRDTLETTTPDVMTPGEDRKHIYATTSEQTGLKPPQLEYLRELETKIFHSVCSRMQVHPSSVVTLTSNKSLSAKGRRVDDPETWYNRRYFIEKDGAFYQLHFEYADSGEKCWADLVQFPPEELLVQFASIAAARELAGGATMLLPIDHPDYESDSVIPNTDGVDLEKVTITYKHTPGEYDGPAPGEGIRTGSPFGEV